MTNDEKPVLRHITLILKQSYYTKIKFYLINIISISWKTNEFVCSYTNGYNISKPKSLKANQWIMIIFT